MVAPLRVMPPPVPVMLRVPDEGLVSVPEPLIWPPFQVNVPPPATMERLPVKVSVPVLRLMLVLELVVPVSNASAPPVTLMVLLDVRLLEGSSRSVPPLGTPMFAPNVLRLRMTPLALVSTVIVVLTFTMAVSPAPGTPVGLQRVDVLQLNGELPLVVV